MRPLPPPRLWAREAKADDSPGIFIIGAPSFFSTVWGWVKKWFDPVTVSKIFILGPNEVQPVLTSFIDVKNIPKAYGGELEWDFYDEPLFDDEIHRIMKWENGHTKLPPGPMYWRPCNDGTGPRLELVAVGSQNKHPRMERVATIPVALPEGKPAETQVPAPTENTTAAPAAAGATEGDVPISTEAATNGLEDLSLKDEQAAVLSEKSAADVAPEKETVASQ